METMTGYLKCKLHKEIIQKVKRKPYIVSSYSRCLHCNVKLQYWNLTRQPICSQYCGMMWNHTKFLAMCGC